ncbi:hypothetical protein CMK11_02530, partial [Candidatus Poribacteria bacterium]|nr:hypothetical protein [Candidatus Poribacteria bacterium]
LVSVGLTSEELGRDVSMSVFPVMRARGGSASDTAASRDGGCAGRAVVISLVDARNAAGRLSDVCRGGPSFCHAWRRGVTVTPVAAGFDV